METWDEFSYDCKSGGRAPRSIPYPLPSQLNRTLTHSLVASLLVLMSLLGGFIPEFSWQSSHPIFSSSAYTQDFNATQIANYARAVLQIEPHRQQAYQAIQKILGQPPPEIVCSQPNSLRKLPREAQRVAVNYCKISKKIVEGNQLSISQFNQITVRVRSDGELKRLIQNAMIRIQRER